MTPPNLIALVAAIVGLVMFALAAVFAADWKDAPRNACLILGGVACAVAIGAWVGGHVGEDAVRVVARGAR